MPITAISVPLPSEPALPDWKPSRPVKPGIPANDNFPWRPRVLGRSFGRATPVGRLMDAYDIGHALGVGIATLLNTHEQRKRKHALQWTHVRVRKCPVPITHGPYSNQSAECGSPNYHSSSTSLQDNLNSGTFPNGPLANSDRIYYINITQPYQSWYARRLLAERWDRKASTSNAPLPVLDPVMVPGMPDADWMLDPNTQRQQPGDPVEQEPPEPERPPEQWRYQSDGRPSTRPHRREPPDRKTKERKAISRSARLGIALYKALDNLSEKAELVDVLFKALPEDVQRRWKRGRDDRAADQFGQYGLEGSDWKAQALWHNWHKIDLEQAARGILQNFAEDSMIGMLQRGMPRNVVNAFQRELPRAENGNMQQVSPETILSKWVDAFFKEAW